MLKKLPKPSIIAVPDEGGNRPVRMDLNEDYKYKCFYLKR